MSQRAGERSKDTSASPPWFPLTLEVRVWCRHSLPLLVINSLVKTDYWAIQCCKLEDALLFYSMQFWTVIHGSQRLKPRSNKVVGNHSLTLCVLYQMLHVFSFWRCNHWHDPEQYLLSKMAVPRCIRPTRCHILLQVSNITLFHLFEFFFTEPLWCF